jgi:hypothetical protein
VICILEGHAGDEENFPVVIPTHSTCVSFTLQAMSSFSVSRSLAQSFWVFPVCCEEQRRKLFTFLL